MALQAIQSDSTYAKKADASDDCSVVGRGQSIICGSDDALGSATSGRFLNVDLLRRHADCDATEFVDGMVVVKMV